MPDFMLLIVGDTGSTGGLGLHEFKVAPRVGEVIASRTNNGTDDTVELYYRVIAIVHALPPASTAGDIYVRLIGHYEQFQAHLSKVSEHR